MSNEVPNPTQLRGTRRASASAIRRLSMGGTAESLQTTDHTHTHTLNSTPKSPSAVPLRERTAPQSRSLQPPPPSPTLNQSEPEPDPAAVSKDNWGLIRRLHDDDALLYTLNEREHVKIQALLHKNQVRASAVANSDSSDLEGLTASHFREMGGDDMPTQPSGAAASNCWTRSRLLRVLCCSRYGFNDNHRMKLRWDVFVSVIIMYSVCVLPWRLGFDVESHGVFFVMEGVVMDVLFGIDMVLSLLSFKPGQKGRRPPWHVSRARYMKSWFLIDFFSTVPLEGIVALLLSGSADANALRSVKLVRVLRLTRLLKMARLVKLQRLRRRLRRGKVDWTKLSATSSQWRRARPAVVRLVILITAMLFCAHLLACGWHGLLYLQEDNYSWWLTTAVEATTEAEDLSTGFRYLLSLYWVVATMMAVGYGDIHAVTTTERVYAIGVQVMGASFIGVLLGTVGQLLDSLNAASNAFVMKLQEVREYIRDRQLPQPLATRLLHYYSTFLQRTTLFNETEIFNGLSLPLRNAIMDHSHEKTILSLRFFRTADADLRASFLRSMRPMMKLAGETVAEEAGLGRELFFLVSGAVEMVAAVAPVMAMEESLPPNLHDEVRLSMETPSQMRVGMYTSGVHFGLVAVFLCVPRPATYTCITMSDIQCISKLDLEVALYDFPDQHKKLEAQALTTQSAVEKVKIDLADELWRTRYEAAARQPTRTKSQAFLTFTKSVRAGGARRPGSAVSVPGAQHIDSSSGSDVDTVAAPGCWTAAQRRWRRVTCQQAPIAPMPPPPPRQGQVIPVAERSTSANDGGGGPGDRSGGSGRHRRRSSNQMRLAGATPSTNGAGDPDGGPDGGRAKRTNSPAPLHLSDVSSDSDIGSVVLPLPSPSSPTAAAANATTGFRRPYDNLQRWTSAKSIRELPCPTVTPTPQHVLNGKLAVDHRMDPIKSATSATKMIRALLLMEPRATTNSAARSSARKLYWKDCYDIVKNGRELPRPGQIVGGRHVTEKTMTMEDLRRRWILHPEDPYKLAMDLLILAIVLVSVIEVPLVLAFDIPDTLLLVSFEVAMDVLFVADIVLHFRTGFRHPDNVVNCVPPYIARAYLHDGFWLDFWSSLPLDRVIGVLLAFDSSVLRSIRLLRFIRMFRLLKLMRFVKLRRKFLKIQHTFVISPNVQRLAKLSVQLFVTGHVLGCFFFWISDISTEHERWWRHTTSANASTFDLYVASLYWASSTMVTVGYGDIVPITAVETAYVIFSMILGAVVFGYVVGTIGVTASSLVAPTLRHTHRMQELVEYLHERRVPEALFKRTCKQYDFFLTRKSAFDEDVILGELPDSLRQEVILHLNKDVVRSVPYFLDKDKDFVLHIVSLLRPQYVHPGDYIYRSGEVAWEMYFLTKGAVELTAVEDENEEEEEETLVVLGEGSYFGELALLLGLRRSVSARAVEHTNIFSLHKDGIRQMILTFPALADKMEASLRKDMDMVLNVKAFTRMGAFGGGSSEGASPENGGDGDSGGGGGGGSGQEDSAADDPSHSQGPTTPGAGGWDGVKSKFFAEEDQVSGAAGRRTGGGAGGGRGGGGGGGGGVGNNTTPALGLKKNMFATAAAVHSRLLNRVLEKKHPSQEADDARDNVAITVLRQSLNGISGVEAKLAQVQARIAGGEGGAGGGGGTATIPELAAATSTAAIDAALRRVTRGKESLTSGASAASLTAASASASGGMDSATARQLASARKDLQSLTARLQLQLNAQLVRAKASTRSSLLQKVINDMHNRVKIKVKHPNRKSITGDVRSRKV